MTPTHAAIAAYTERQLQHPPEELRAEIEAGLAEIRAGWLGVSDFMIEAGRKREGQE